jgi:hypothetical protein
VIVETKVIVVTDLVGLFQQAPTWLIWPARRTQRHHPIGIHVGAMFDSLTLLECVIS